MDQSEPGAEGFNFSNCCTPGFKCSITRICLWIPLSPMMSKYPDVVAIKTSFRDFQQAFSVAQQFVFLDVLLVVCEIINEEPLIFLEQGNMNEELVFLNKYNELCMLARTLLQVVSRDYSLCTCEMKDVML